MRYGFYLPTRGPTATRDGVLTLAREGERLGFHSAMIADHIVFPVESESAYPYTLDGKHPGGGDALETFSILGVVAGATERLRLVTSVLVLPYRNPVLTAKMVASLDVLSGGRVTLGVGVGWLKEEFAVLAASLPGLRIKKLRYRLRSPPGVVLSLDQFQGELDGLVMLEAEFNTLDLMASFAAPDFAVREVTDDPRYSGGHLVTHGLPEDRTASPAN